MRTYHDLPDGERLFLWTAVKMHTLKDEGFFDGNLPVIQPLGVSVGDQLIAEWTPSPWLVEQMLSSLSPNTSDGDIYTAVQLMYMTMEAREAAMLATQKPKPVPKAPWWAFWRGWKKSA